MIRLVPLLLALAGCVQTTQLFPGPRRPEREVAVLRVDGDNMPVAPRYGDFAFHVKLLRVNGKPVPPGQSRYALLPGRHELEFSWEREFIFDTRRDNAGASRLTLDAKPGYNYSIGWNPIPTSGDPELQLNVFPPASG